MTTLPPEITFNGTTYRYSKALGRGGTGAVGLYGDVGVGQLVLKVSYCNVPDGLRLATEESANAAAVVASGACAPADVLWRGGGQAYMAAATVRAPLATDFRDGCAYAIYEYAPENLADWLKRHATRKPADVVSIFLQVVSILRCLKARQIYYDDIKPSNLLVWDDGNGPRVKIGDLGGLDRFNDKSITFTPTRLPPTLRDQLSWDRVDILTSFLLGELILQLLIKPTAPGASNAMNDFFACLQASDKDGCVATLLAHLRTHLAGGLSFKQGQIRDLAALALNLLGFRGLYISADDIPHLDTSLVPRGS